MLTRPTMKRYLSPMHTIAPSLMIIQPIIFVNAECGPEQIVVIFFRQGHKRCSWSEFEDIGTEAMSAVVAAKWDCGRLQKLAKSFENREISISETECALQKQREYAERRKFYESKASAFEWD